MGHQCRHSHRLKHAARYTAKDALLKARMAIAPHHDQIETLVGGD